MASAGLIDRISLLENHILMQNQRLIEMVQIIEENRRLIQMTISMHQDLVKNLQDTFSYEDPDAGLPDLLVLGPRYTSDDDLIN